MSLPVISRCRLRPEASLPVRTRGGALDRRDGAALRDRVTVLDPGVDLFAAPVPAGAAMLNGAGECTGLRGCAPSGTPVTGTGLDSYFAVVVEATEEAVLNSMLQAETVSGRSGNISSRLPPTLRTTFTPGARDE